MGEGEEVGRENSGGEKGVSAATSEGGKGAAYFYSQSSKDGWFV